MRCAVSGGVVEMEMNWDQIVRRHKKPKKPNLPDIGSLCGISIGVLVNCGEVSGKGGRNWGDERIGITDASIMHLCIFPHAVHITLLSCAVAFSIALSLPHKSTVMVPAAFRSNAYIFSAFERARGYPIERGAYVQALHRASKERRSKKYFLFLYREQSI